jgi:hypothetical protein
VPRYTFANSELQKQLIDHHGTKTSTFEANVVTFDFGTGPGAFLPVKSDHGRQGAIGLNLGLGAEYRDQKGEEQRLVVDERNSDIQRILSKEVPPSNQKSGRWVVAPWVEIPWAYGFATSLIAEAAYKYPDLTNKDRTGQHRVALELGQKNLDGTLGFGTQVYYRELINPGSQLTTAVNGASIGGFGELLPQLAVSAEARHEIYEYRKKELSINGPDSLSIVEVNAVHGFPLGFAVKLSGTFEHASRFVYFDMPTYGSLVADGNSVSGLAMISLGGVPTFTSYPWHALNITSAVPHISASISALARKTTWDLEKPETREVFELNVPNYIERIVARLSVNLNF